MEVAKSIEVAYALCPIFTRFNVDMEVHADINTNPSFKSNDALKEAMASGLMAIGTWHAGNSELIDDRVSGFLVAEKNVDQLANAIEYIIENPQLWEQIGRNARKKVKDEFETKKSVKKLEEIFYQLLDSSKAKDALLDDEEDDYYP